MDGVERSWYLSGAYASMIRGEKPLVYSNPHRLPMDEATTQAYEEADRAYATILAYEENQTVDIELEEMTLRMDDLRAMLGRLDDDSVDDATFARSILSCMYQVFLLMERRIRRLEPIVQVLTKQNSQPAGGTTDE